MNKIFLIGNLTKDPVLRTVKTEKAEKAVANFTVAVNRVHSANDKDADFFPIVVWGSMAESCGKYLKKGSRVCVVGPLQTKSYDAEDGLKRYTMEVNAAEVQFLSAKPDEEKKEGKKNN